MKKIGIFTTNESFVHEWIKLMTRSCKASNIDIKSLIAKNDISVEFSNGDYCKWIRPNSSSRGQKVTDAIVDIATCSCEEISTIILPSIVNFEREPEITIMDLNHKDYNIDTLIDRLEKVRLIKGNLEVGYNCPEWGYTEIWNIDITKDNCLLLR